jgi:hypothetical protein
MTRHRILHTSYDYLIGTALIDRDLAHALLQDPQGTALRFGLTSNEASLMADISAPNIHSFAATLLPRLYGDGTTRVLHRSAVAG